MQRPTYRVIGLLGLLAWISPASTTGNSLCEIDDPSLKLSAESPSAGEGKTLTARGKASCSVG